VFGRRSEPSDHLRLIAATAILVLTFENFLADRLSQRESDRVATDAFAPELSHGRGRHSISPFRIP
jgi:hypothetical protein